MLFNKSRIDRNLTKNIKLTLTNVKMDDYFHMHDSDNDDLGDDLTYFDSLLYKYRSIGYVPSLFRKRRTTTFEKVTQHANKSINFINRIKSMQLACYERANSIPKNATIRKEYVNCGKEACEELHGPYYYAYWKDAEGKKLKKKYIGTYYPPPTTKTKNKLELK
jgi:hypothetical protein